MEKQDIEKLAKGIFDPVIKWKLWWDEEVTNKKKLLTKRRMARRAIFKIRKNLRDNNELDDPKLIALKNLIDQQIDPNMGLSYESFTHKWDIHPNHPTTIIIEEKWFIEGGSVDPVFGNIKDPTAFTKQE